MSFQYIIIAGAVMAAAVIVLLLKARNRKKKVFAEMLLRFSHLGTVHGLNFTSQEILKHGVLGLDAKKGKLVLLQISEQNSLTPFFVNLSYVKKCLVRRTYITIQDKYLLTIEPRKEIESIILCFEGGFGELPAEIIFYKAGIDQVDDLSVLENKAVDWEHMLNRLIPQKFSV